MLRCCPASRRGGGPVTGAILIAALGGNARADDEHVSLRAEIGTEYDSNVHRAEEIPGAASPPVVGSPLGRVVLGWSAADRLGATQDVAFSLLGAAKAFSAAEARNENVGIVESSGLWRVAMGEKTRVGIGAAYYEAIQSGSPTERELAGLNLTGDPRDFRSLAPTLRAQRAIGNSGALALGVGYRWFVYKPNRGYDFTAPVLTVEYHLTHETADGGADWDVGVGSGVELREFAGVRLIQPLAGCTTTDPSGISPSSICVTAPDPFGTKHSDQFYTGHIDVTHTGRVLVGAGYAIQGNRSNSYGESVLFHVGTVRFTAPLPLGVYLAARTELVYAAYADPIASVVGPDGRASATIEDENRSQVRAELSRDIGAHLQLVARYSLYVNALNQRATPTQDTNGSNTPTLGQGKYLRQTATLSLVYSID